VLHVLFVDDNETDFFLVKDAARNYSISTDVRRATNGLDALRLLSELKPDLVLLDLNMPKFGGLDLLRVLEPQKSAPVVVFTDSFAYREKQTVLSLGAVDFVTKPTDLARFRSVIWELIDKWGRADRHQPPIPPSNAY
jgi:DNA-binding response OmpR family regulator